jgi:hypothetical protein
MGPVQFDAQNPDVTENPYFKNLRDSLKKKADSQKKISQTTNSSEALKVESDVSKVIVAEEGSKKDDALEFEDKVHLSALSFEEDFLSDEKQDDASLDEKQKQELELKTNGERVLRYLGHKIDFKSKLPELKLLLKETVIQAKSHNYFLSQFAKFKVGVVGQLLAALNVPLSELKDIKREAFKDAFDENVEMMGENVYNQELSELLGHSKRKRRMAKVYGKVQTQLMSQMNNLGRVGFWSKNKLMEEKIKQLKRIHDEFSKERTNLEYMLAYKLQRDVAEAA